MEFQIVNEVSSFWENLVPPIFLGTISLFLFLWIIGKQNRESLMKRFVDTCNNQYVLENGIYIPKDHTIKYVFVHKLLDKLGISSLRPLIILFITVLIFFGINQLLLQIFQPMLVYSPGSLIYSSSVDEYIIASIWSYYPDVKSSDQLYTIIMDLTKDVKFSSKFFLYSVEAFIRFDILCCIIAFFRMFFIRKKLKFANKTVFKRLFIIFLSLMFALAGTFFINIQIINHEFQSRCYTAYSILEDDNDITSDLGSDLQYSNIESYLTVIKQDKERYGKDLYYGAFGIRSQFVKYITDTIREFYRFFSYQ